MEAVSQKIERLHFGVGDLFSKGVFAAVESRSDDKACSRRRRTDEAHHGLERAEWSSSPVDRDEREETMFDLVPLARAWWKVAHAHGDAVLVSERLKLGLPDARPRSVASAGVGCDVNRLRGRIALSAHLKPPGLEGLGREPWGVVIVANDDECAVVGDVENATFVPLPRKVDDQAMRAALGGDRPQGNGADVLAQALLAS